LAAVPGTRLTQQLVKGDALEVQRLGNVFHHVICTAPVRPRPIQTVCIHKTIPDSLRQVRPIETNRDFKKTIPSGPELVCVTNHDYRGPGKTSREAVVDVWIQSTTDLDCLELRIQTNPDCLEQVQQFYPNNWRKIWREVAQRCSADDRSRLSRLPAVLKALTMKAAFGLDGRLGSSGVLGLTNVYISL